MSFVLFDFELRCSLVLSSGQLFIFHCLELLGLNVWDGGIYVMVAIVFV